MRPFYEETFMRRLMRFLLCGLVYVALRQGPYFFFFLLLSKVSHGGSHPHVELLLADIYP